MLETLLAEGVRVDPVLHTLPGSNLNSVRGVVKAAIENGLRLEDIAIVDHFGLENPKFGYS